MRALHARFLTSRRLLHQENQVDLPVPWIAHGYRSASPTMGKRRNLLLSIPSPLGIA